MKKIIDYKLFIFDCDGVILNSNRIKTNAFANTVKFLGEEAAETFKTYHVNNGGISRYEKFKYFLDIILPELGITTDVDMDKLLLSYADQVKYGLLSCEVDKSLLSFKTVTPQAHWAVASGSDELELRFIFKQRSLDSLFDLGIWGSPKTKKEIFNLQFAKYDPKEILFIGDSLYDYKVANEFGCEFVFLSHWSEFNDIENFSRYHKIPIYPSLQDLIEAVSP